MGIFLTCLGIFLQYYSPGEVVPSLAPFRIEFIVLGTGIIASLPSFAVRNLKGLQQPQTMLMLAFWCSIVISHLSHRWIRSGLESFFYFGPIIAIFFLVALNAYTIRRIKLIAGTILFCGVALSIEAILAYHTGYKASQLLLYQPGEYQYSFGNRVRAYGILQDPNDFAQFLLICISLIGMFWKRGMAHVQAILIPVAGILMYAVYLTFSRGALFGLCAIIYFALGRKLPGALRLVVAGATLVALVGIRFTGNREVSMEGGRLVAWGAGIGGVIAHPFFGVGFNHFTDINSITAHNSFVLCVAELGFFGYFFWMAFILTTAYGLAGLTKSTMPDETAGGLGIRQYAKAMQAALGAFLATSWFLSRTYQMTLYVLVALAGNLIQMSPKDAPPTATQFHKYAPKVIALEFLSLVVVYVMIRLRAI